MDTVRSAPESASGGDSCGCTESSPDGGRVAPVRLTHAEEVPAPPIVCTLESDAVEDRLSMWSDVLAYERARQSVGPGRLRVEFDDGIDLARLATLTASEQRCCSFLSFAITLDHRGAALEVAAPADAQAVIDTLFGAVGSPPAPAS